MVFIEVYYIFSAMVLFGQVFFEKGDLGHVFFSKMTIICWHKSGQGQGCSLKRTGLTPFPSITPISSFIGKKALRWNALGFFTYSNWLFPWKELFFFSKPKTRNCEKNFGVSMIKKNLINLWLMKFFSIG